MGELIFGVVFWVAAGLLFRSASASKRKMEAMESTETNTVEFLNSLARSMSEGVGAGSLRYASEVRGKVVCAEPLISELAQVACVHYAMRVQRRSEETYTARDRQGRAERKTRTITETVASNERSIPFDVDDGTGSIRIHPEHAEFVAEKVVSRFDTAAAAGNAPYTVGSLAVDSGRFPEAGGRRTIGYQFEEEAVPVGREVYVLGEATDRDGGLAIGSPGAEGRFIISVKSESALLQEERSAARWKRIGSIACAAAGLIALLTGLFR